MKFFTYLVLGLAITAALTVDFQSAFIKGEIKTTAITYFFKNEFLELVEEILPCIEIQKITETVQKPLFKLEVTLENLKFTKIALPKENYNIEMYHGSSALDVAKLRCEKENSQGCELQNNAYYPKCKSNFVGDNETCKPHCPSGFHDTGLDCSKPSPYGRGTGYPWKFGDGFTLEKAKERCLKDHPVLGCQKVGEIYYPNCKAGFHNVACCICSPNCPSGFTDTGEFCHKPGSYSRKKYQDNKENVMITTENGFTAALDGLITIAVDGVTDLTRGKLDVSTSGSNFYGRLGMSEKSGSLQFSFEEMQVQLNNFDITLSGSFSADVLNAIISVVEGLIKSKIEDLFNELGSSIEPVINQKLMELPKKFVIGEAGLEIDYDLLEAPETYSDEVKFYLNGTVLFNPKDNKKELKPQFMSTNGRRISKDDDIEIQVNQDGINEILKHAYEANLLHISQDLNYSTFGINVKHSNIACVEYAPSIKISADQITANVSLQMNTTMQQGATSPFKNYSMTVQVVPALTAAFKDNALKITILSIELVDLKGPMPEQMGMPKEFFIAMLKGILAQMIPTINEKIPAIQIPSFDGVTLSASKLTLNDKSLDFQTKFSYSQELIDTLKEVIFQALEDPAIQSVVPIENICKKTDMIFE